MRCLARTAAAGVLWSLTVSCVSDSLTGTPPLTFAISVDVRTVTAGQNVVFSYEAEGSGLSQIVIAFGDGDTYTKNLPPASVRSTGFTNHTYTSTGTFMVRAEATDFTGVAADELTITVN